MIDKDIFRAFKEQCIELTIYDNVLTGIRKIRIDTSIHDAKVRADAIEECKKIVMAECATTCEYTFFPNCVECMTNKMEQLKEQKNENTLFI